MTDEKVEIQETSLAQVPNYEITVRDHRIYRMVYYAMGVLEVLLCLRFVFKLLGANPTNVFAAIIYAFSSFFVLPFLTLFPRAETTEIIEVHKTFEPGTIVAMAVYALLAVGVAKLILIMRSRPTKEKKAGW